MYTVTVNGNSYVVEVADGGDVTAIAPAAVPAPAAVAAPVSAASEPLAAPLAGNIVRIEVSPGDSVAAGDVVLILEAMKMETEVRASRDGSVTSVDVKVGDSVAVGDNLLTLG